MRRKSERFAFTVARLKALKPKAERYWVLDSGTPGLAVMVTPAGKRTYYYVRKVDGRAERVHLGPVGMPEDALRKALGTAQGQIAAGQSPTRARAARRAEEAAKSKRVTFGEAFEHYCTSRTERGKDRVLVNDRGRFNHHLAGWAGRPLEAITKDDVKKLVAHVKKTSGPVAANRTRTMAFSIFKEGGVADNPAKVEGRERAPESSRARYLEPVELRRLWRAVLVDEDETIRDLVRLLLLTAVRSGTLKTARWADLDFEGKRWRIPAQYMKSGKALDLPLAAPIVDLFRERAQRAGASAWVFPSPRNAEEHIACIPRKSWLRVLANAKIADLRPHDLRRTNATYGLSVGIPLEVVGGTLGHAVENATRITAIYARTVDQLLRLAVERTTSAILGVVEAPETEDVENLLAFPVPAWAKGGAA
jgi:integrase